MKFPDFDGCDTSQSPKFCHFSKLLVLDHQMRPVLLRSVGLLETDLAGGSRFRNGLFKMDHVQWIIMVDRMWWIFRSSQIYILVPYIVIHCGSWLWVWVIVSGCFSSFVARLQARIVKVDGRISRPDRNSQTRSLIMHSDYCKLLAFSIGMNEYDQIQIPCLWTFRNLRKLQETLGSQLILHRGCSLVFAQLIFRWGSVPWPNLHDLPTGLIWLDLVKKLSLALALFHHWDVKNVAPSFICDACPAHHKNRRCLITSDKDLEVPGDQKQTASAAPTHRTSKKNPLLCTVTPHQHIKIKTIQPPQTHLVNMENWDIAIFWENHRTGEHCSITSTPNRSARHTVSQAWL